MLHFHWHFKHVSLDHDFHLFDRSQGFPYILNIQGHSGSYSASIRAPPSVTVQFLYAEISEA